MILVALIWLLIFSGFFILGFSVVKVISRTVGQVKGGDEASLNDYFFIGFLTLSFISGMLSIWIPIGDKVMYITGLFILLLWLLNFREIRDIIKKCFQELIVKKRGEKIILSSPFY